MIKSHYFVKKIGFEMEFQAEKKLVRELFEKLMDSNEFTVENIFVNFVSDDYIFKGGLNIKFATSFTHIM